MAKRKKKRKVKSAIEVVPGMVAHPTVYDSLEMMSPEDYPEGYILQKHTQWTSSDDTIFLPSSRSVGKLKPACYEIKHSDNLGVFFERVSITTDNILKFPDSTSDKIIGEIEKFWEREHLFQKYGLVYKRGILLYGPPGSGKTCIIKLLVSDLINNRKGVVLKFTEPTVFSEGLRILRSIQKDTPIIVLMEDIDAIVEAYNESQVINILDGIDQVDKIVFLATTNYIEKLGARIANRPSRFDRRIKIGMPDLTCRTMYLAHISKGVKIDIRKWAADTEDLSLAHLKELFTSVVIMQNEYDDALDTLKSMKNSLSSLHDGEKMGFQE